MVWFNPLSDLILIVGQCDRYFMVQSFCLIFLSLSAVHIILGLMGWADPLCDILVEGQCDLYFMVQ